MPLQCYLADARTGLDILPISPSDISVETRAGTWETMRVVVNLADKRNRMLDLWSNSTPGRTMLGIATGDFVHGAGPVWEQEWDEDSKRLTLTAEGIESLLDYRFIMPAAAETTSLVQRTGKAAGEPNPALKTSFVGKSWPVIVRGIVEQSTSLSGGALPLVYPNTPAGGWTGAHDIEYDAVSFKTVASALTDIRKLDDGPEIRFRPRFMGYRDGFEFVVESGDDAQPELTSSVFHRFDFGARRPSVRSLKVKRSAGDMVTNSWATGGRQASLALTAIARSTLLTDQGFPRMEALDTGHSTVVKQATLNAYAREALTRGSRFTDWWSYVTDTRHTPRMGTFDIGDYGVHVLGDRSSALIPGGRYVRRIAGMAISTGGGEHNVRVTTAEAAA